MKKLILLTAATASLALAATAFGNPLVEVVDPTPNGAFTGTYDKGDTDGDGVNETGTQQGYIAVYGDGAEACNGNPDLKRPDDGTPLVGYIWVGSSHAASNVTGQTPGGEVGAGNNHEDENGDPTGASPCPRNG